MSRGTLGLDRRLNDYVVACGDREHPVAAKLAAATADLPEASMQIAPEQGQLLAFLAKTIGAREVLEIGTFYGYSALWLALALPAGGRVVACDINEATSAAAAAYWEEAGVLDRIDLRIAPALDTLAELEAEGDRFDLVFVDADKDAYRDYYEASLRLLRRGGLVVFDNTLRDGAVADPADTSPGTESMRAFNAFIADDPRVDRVLLPLGDGMTVARRI